MQELIKRIAQQSGVSKAKASQILETVSQFVKEKYPLLSGTVDSVLGTKADHSL